MLEKFYKDRYLLALYNKNDELVLLVDNVEQLAEKLNKSVKTTRVMVSHVVNSNNYNRKWKSFNYNNQFCNLFLIDMLN